MSGHIQALQKPPAYSPLRYIVAFDMMARRLQSRRIFGARRDARGAHPLPQRPILLCAHAIYTGMGTAQEPRSLRRIDRQCRSCAS
jgi:hypothetical protein